MSLLLKVVVVKASTWEASLMVSGADGSGEFALQTVRRPNFFDERGIAWSPDGEAIACFAGGQFRGQTALALSEFRSRLSGRDDPPKLGTHVDGGSNP
jgi:hypothetical protein